MQYLSLTSFYDSIIADIDLALYREQSNWTPFDFDKLSIVFVNYHSNGNRT